MIYGLKCLVAANIARASISHGSQAMWWALSFALKNPASANFSLRVMYSVAAMPGLLTAPSVTIQSWSKGCGRVMVRLSVKPLCKMEGVTQIVCLGDVLLWWKPCDSGVQRCEHWRAVGDHTWHDLLCADKGLHITNFLGKSAWEGGDAVGTCLELSLSPNPI